MYKLFVIAKNNMKKQRGDMITFFILTFLAAFLIFDCASAILGMGHVIDQRYRDVNAADIMLVTNDNEIENECAEKAIKENAHIKDYDSVPILVGDIEYKEKNEKEYGEFNFVIENYASDKNYMNTIDEEYSLGDRDIIIPYYLKNRFKVGDIMQLRIKDDVYDMEVAGYAEDPYFCSSINLTIYYVYTNQAFIDNLEDKYYENEYSPVSPSTLHMGKLSDSDYDTSKLEHEVTDDYKNGVSKYSSEHPEVRVSYIAVNWDMMRGGSQFVPMIVMAIMLIFAVLILIIALVIISFSIRNFIQRNMKNTGILEASGYTVKELRFALIMQMIIVALLGSICGIALGAATFSSFGNVVSMILGLSWNQPINWAIGIITLVGLLLVVFLVSLGISKAYKKITVLDALRGGIATHNFKRNLFSFEKTPLPIPAVLSLKDTFGGLGRNLVIAFIVFILTVSVLVGIGMLENFGINPHKLVDIMGFELGSMYVVGDNGIADDLRELDSVDNVLSTTGIEPTVTFGDETESIYTYVYDDAKNGTATILIEGRLPKSDNEVMLTEAAAGDLGVKVGDVIEVSFANKKADYLVTGLNQRMERMGRTMIMTYEAAERIVPGELPRDFIVTAKEGISYSELEKEVMDYAEDNNLDLTCTDSEKQMQSIVSSLASAMKMVCLVIVVVTTLIVVFVETLVIKAKITREWKGMGISKALGMTSGGLISQIALSNIPAVILGSVIGACIAQIAGKGVCIAAFSIFGIETVTFEIAPVWMLVAALGMLVVAIITSGLSGLKVRKLIPVEMITEE